MGFTNEQKAELEKPLSKSRVKERSQSGRTFSYIEGYDAIDTANRIFGYDGWSMRVDKVSRAGEWERTDRNGVVIPVVLYAAKVTVRVGIATRQDIGHGITAGDNAESHETAMKGAVTDAMKRALRTFGPQFGNSLYDKDGPELAEPAPKDHGHGICAVHNEPFVKSQKTGVVGHAVSGGEPCIKQEAA